ncbi:MAG: response regulator [bacterium]
MTYTNSAPHSLHTSTDPANDERHILVVEDEIKIARLLQDYLHANHFNSSHLEDGAEVVDWVKQHKPDAILLDLMLPHKDGISICQEIRQFSQVPIIMLTARAEEIDRILGLEIGANDYICKPFSPREVMARLKSLFRLLDSVRQRSQAHDTTNTESTENRLQLNPAAYEAQYQQQLLPLTPVEFRLLHKLYTNPQQVFSRQQLVEGIYVDNRVITDRTIDTHIKNLRKKLAQVGLQSGGIRSIYGVGYRWQHAL